jgi:F-type H+-transporting ATPase subunit epsilon
MAGLHFELVSPAKLLFSGDVASVTLPGTEGEMTIMPMHAPVLATLRPGGFAEVNAKGLTVLAETAIAMADLDASTMSEQIKSAEVDVAEAKDDETKRRANENLDHLKSLQAGQ